MPLLKKFKIKIPIPKFLSIWLGHPKIRRLLWSILFFSIALGVFALHFLPDRISLNVGQVSPVEITASRYLTYEDEEATEKKRMEAAQSVEDVYILNEEIINDTKKEISTYFKRVLGVIVNPKLNNNEKIKALQSFKWELSEEDWRKIIELDPIKIEALEKQTLGTVEKTFAQGINNDNLTYAENEILSAVDLFDINPEYTRLIKGVLSSIKFKPNLLFDPVATEIKRNEARDAIEPVSVVIQKNERIVAKGDVLSQRQVNILTWLGYKNNASAFAIISGLVLFMGLIMFLGSLFLRHYRKELYRNETYLVLIMLLVVVILILAKIVLAVKLSNIPERAEQVGHMIPVAAGTMLIAILIDTKLAIFITVIFTMFVALLTGKVFFVLTAFTGGLIGIYSVSQLSQRSDLAKASLWVSLGNIFSVLSVGLLYNLDRYVILYGAGFAIANGILSSILTIGLLPYLESGFKITTSVRLLELSNPNHPLLKRLLLEAPGTYHHSIMVGNLGESAADAIGADSLLVRVGSYYHDIGKIKRPYFFVENQLAGDNPHDKIAPSLSTLIITSHIKDGVELAKSHSIPNNVIDMIAQHHGTSLVRYFYMKAKETEKENIVKEEDFRYEAVKPQTREAAIIMLADSVEAAVRAMKEPNSGKIEGLIRNIIKEKLNDGQMEECNLTFKDLDKIANAFVRVFNGIYHSRIEYPDSVLKALEKKGEKNESDNQQLPEKGGITPSVGS